MTLTDTAIRKFKPTHEVKRLFDGGGLYLEVSPKGGKWWRYKYRIGGKEKRLSFGTYPDTSLAVAREQHSQARQLVARGIDPSAQRKAEKAAGAERAANSFAVVAREWMGKHFANKAESHSSKVIARLENDVFPWLGKCPIADITAPDVLQVIRRIEDRGAIETAKRALQSCSQVFRYAVVTGRASVDPTTVLRGALTPTTVKHHAAITTPARFGELLRAIDGFQGEFATVCALKLAALVFVRPGELRQAEWSEFDLDAGMWCIPASKMKGKEEHIVPLSSQSVAILRELHPLTQDGRYLFPSTRTRSGSKNERPMSNNTLNAALRRMGYDNSTATAHGFRASARTMLDEQLGFRPDFIEHQLAHEVKDPLGRAYNRTSHLPERKVMMQAWADYLDQLKAAAPGKVVPFRKHAA